MIEMTSHGSGMLCECTLQNAVFFPWTTSEEARHLTFDRVCRYSDSQFRGILWGASVTSSSSSQEVTQLLVRWKTGDSSALETLLPLVYDELRKLARHYLASERPDHTLQTTELVHVAYLRLVDQSAGKGAIENRAHFFGIAAHLMRQILVDHARARLAHKRAGSVVTLDESANMIKNQPLDLVALDDALAALARLDEQQARIVELRFFAGLSIEDTALALDISPATVKRNWTAARLWLYRELSRGTKH
jgi:RNA polymerase sigma factor (TIGR02999 family)